MLKFNNAIVETSNTTMYKVARWVTVGENPSFLWLGAIDWKTPEQAEQEATATNQKYGHMIGDALYFPVEINKVETITRVG